MRHARSTDRTSSTRLRQSRSRADLHFTRCPAPPLVPSGGGLSAGGLLLAAPAVVFAGWVGGTGAVVIALVMSAVWTALALASELGGARQPSTAARVRGLRPPGHDARRSAGGGGGQRPGAPRRRPHDLPRAGSLGRGQCAGGSPAGACGGPPEAGPGRDAIRRGGLRREHRDRRFRPAGRGVRRRRRAQPDGRRPLAGADRPQPGPGRRAGLRGRCGRRGRGAWPGGGRRRRPRPDLGLREPSGHAQHRRPDRRGGPPPDAPALAGGRVGHRPRGAAGRRREPGRQDRPGPGRCAGPAGAGVAGPAGHVGRGPDGLARARALRADPRRARRRAVPDVQDAQHAHRRRGAAGRARGGERDGRRAVQDPPRPPGHAGRATCCAAPRSTSSRSCSTWSAGDMSLVGPRPALPAEVATYDAGELRRLAVKPGITGLWQVSGRSDLSLGGGRAAGPLLRRQLADCSTTWPSRLARWSRSRRPAAPTDPEGRASRSAQVADREGLPS